MLIPDPLKVDWDPLDTRVDRKEQLAWIADDEIGWSYYFWPKFRVIIRCKKNTGGAMYWEQMCVMNPLNSD